MNRKQRRVEKKRGGPLTQGASPGAQMMFNEALRHHQAGRLNEAERFYRQILAVEPRHGDSLHLLGVIAYQMGRHDVAVDLVNRAITINAKEPVYHSNLGNALREQGKLDEAVVCYREALVLNPSYAEAHSNLGNALKDLGNLDEAAVCYRRAVLLKPGIAEIHNNLGTVFKDQGKLDEAVSCYRQAVVLKPDYAEAHSNLGNAFRDQGKLDEAIAAFGQAIVLKPTLAEAHTNLGNALRDLGNLDEAVVSYRRALRLKPGIAEIHNNLGTLFKDQGNLDEAVNCYQQTLVLKPNYAEANSNLGNALRDQGKLDEAIAAFRQALVLNPTLAEAHTNLGNALRDRGKLDEAILCYQQAVVLNPNFAEAHSNLGNALNDQGKLDEAEICSHRALLLKPGIAEIHSNLGNVFKDQGKLDEAVAAYRQALVLKPDYADSHSNLLFCLNYVDDISNEEIYKESVCWNERHALRYRPSNVAYNNERRSDRRLRIGYVSPDLRTHSVAYFLEPLLQGHDRQAVEIFCYADVVQPDSVTTRLQGLADHWLMTIGLSDDKLAARIRTDGIDILIDLAGHTAHNRLGVFAREPAPVQVTWLGYPNTTGLDAIDYRLVDAVTDPVGEADACASETLLRLPSGFLCYGGPEGMPEPADPPCLTAATVTFGSFNNPAKVSPSTLDVWAKLLTRLPEARLLLKGKSFANATTRALFIARLGERGVAPERVELVAWAPSNIAHLALYERVDIALDPFPYNGTTTTCEALWMGVPVITLRGDRHAGRVGASLLSHGGLTDWIAGSVEDYVEIAVALAGNPSHLRDLRRSLRPHLKASPLCDSKAFAGQIEAAFRTMWQQWLDSSASH